MSICSRYERNKEDAEELLNQSFLKILTSMDKYKKEVPFKFWIRKITVNTIIDEYRKNKKLKETMSQVELSEEHSYADAYDLNEYFKKTEAEELLKMIDALPEMAKNVFNMYEIDGFSHKEIAQTLNISDGTSRWYLNYAKTELKKNFAKRDIPSKLPMQ